MMTEENPHSIPGSTPTEPPPHTDPGTAGEEIMEPVHPPEAAAWGLPGPNTGPDTSASIYDRQAVRAGVNLLMVVLVAFTAYLIWQRFGISGQRSVSRAAAGFEAGFESPADAAPEGNANLTLPPLPPTFDSSVVGVSRRAHLLTNIPSRPRTEVITYTVKEGDNLFGIAEAFGLDPETILWGNFDTLKDNPHLVSPGQVLNILPENGTYYQWQDGDRLDQVASSFNTTIDAVLSFSGNNIDLTAAISGTYGLEPGAWIVLPGGTRPFKDWGPPAISRANPASASYYGAGHCGEIYEGPFGVGSFVWPTVDRTISGYHYSAVHRAIDIGGSMGNAIFAADSGVIVYAGWSDYGYGNLVVVDHGNGWQTAYAHLSSIGVSCGQPVGQGNVIGGLGSTGNSSGPHLHFEMIYNGTKPNPMDYVQ